MATIQVLLPDPLQEFVEAQVLEGGYSTTGEYLLDLVRAEQERRTQERLEKLLLDGLDSGGAIEASDGWWRERRSERIANYSRS